MIHSIVGICLIVLLWLLMAAIMIDDINTRLKVDDQKPLGNFKRFLIVVFFPVLLVIAIGGALYHMIFSD